MKYIRFYRYLFKFWKIEAVILTLSSLSMALALINPYLAKLMIDKAYVNRDLKLFIALVIASGVIFMLTGGFKGFSDYLNRYIKLRIKFALERSILRKLQSLSYSFFQDTSTGEHLYKISYDTERTTQFITDLLPQFILLIPKSLLIFIIILYLNKAMALFSILLIPFVYIGAYYFGFRLRKMIRSWVENSQGVFKKLHEILSHIQLVKAFGREGSEIKGYLKILIQNFRMRLRSIKLETKGAFLNNIANRAILGLIIFYGGYQVITDRMTLGNLSAITIYLSQLSGLQSSLSLFFQQMSEGMVSCDRLDAILNKEPDNIETGSASDITLTKGGIEFKNVTFGYVGEGLKPSPTYKKVLDNIRFKIEGGSCIALTGPSGCGKTTIVNLILRLYRPLSGEIAIDGININSISSSSFYNQIGVVLQEPYLWNDAVANNIRYGRPDASLKDIIEAAEITCINSFINSLPDGYNAIIGENACKISEGQKQRIAIARAIIKKPKILILDEALSSVDAELEERIVYNIRNSLKDSTIIIISHRLSTIQKADLVYFLSGPGNINIGSHSEFLEINTQYQNYLAHQV